MELVRTHGRWLAELLIALFFAVLFLQSGIDKLVDRKGNLDWLKGHFAKSPVASLTPVLLTGLTLLELASGMLSAAGALMLLFTRQPATAFLGVSASGFTLLALFSGQRIAKDYAGAAALVPYFLTAIVGLWLFARP